MEILKKYPLEKALFFDVECTRAEKKLPAKGPLRESWEYKMRNKTDVKEEIEEAYLTDAALYGAFNKVVCVTLGRDNGEGSMNVKSYVGEEETILREFYRDLCRFNGFYLVGHTIKTFDIPVLQQRGLVNGVKSPALLDTWGMPPYKLDHLLDVSELWKSLSWNPSSLINIAVAMGITHSKSDIDGSEVSDLYHSSKKDKMERIQKYCEEDVRVVYEIFKKFKALS